MICNNRDTRLKKSWYRKPTKLPIWKNGDTIWKNSWDPIPKHGKRKTSSCV